MIRLKCIKEKSKLRIKIISDGYFNNANCRFPRDIRKEGRIYEVPVNDIKFSEQNKKFFYIISSKNIRIIDNPDEKIKIYENDEIKCVICMENDKNVVFFTCGHYVCCNICSNKISKKCPICRSTILQIIDRNLIE